MIEELRYYISNNTNLNSDSLNYYIESYLNSNYTDEEINNSLEDIKNELDNNLMYDEVEDSYSGGETSFYDNNKNKIELLEDFKYKRETREVD